MWHSAHAPQLVFAGTLTATTTAQQISSSAWPCTQLLVENDENNQVDILLGGSASQVLKLQPGQSLNLEINNIPAIWVVTSSSTALVNWFSVG